ncbi:RNA polymerase I-specific transcription initiation factor RRN3 [Russula earlei]|uniref:RNA polymerase I-specific transcription initiation factor RRN3 n=1 Tax=Russula earlei TaxID=71964 RepID=A0ACC0U2Q4_9AGAM|nr:RNA polymerase I-specific transcription initiation factor RRN3 [Russula earlei]
MDPHSTLSQFNQRPPKAGPSFPNQRQMHMDLLPHPKPPSLNGYAKQSLLASQSRGRCRKSSSSLSSPTVLDDLPRPIATNSRIKQGERLQKDMYLAFVNNALEQKTLGNNEPYDTLVDQFNIKKTAFDTPSPIPQLRQWLQALMHVVSCLDRTHMALIEAIMRLPWMTMESTVVKTYTSFIEILVSARPEYLSIVLGRIAQGFTYQSGLQALEACLPECSSSPLTRRTVYARIHHLLRHLLVIIPTLPSTLQPLLVQNFPHKRQSQLSQVTYIRNILRVTDYCPEIADNLLSTIIDRTIQMDVEIQVELEELEASGATQEQAELFDLDPFDIVVGQEQLSDTAEDEEGSEDGIDGFSDLSSEAAGEEDDDEAQKDESIDLGRITEMVNKLDAILKLLFDHFSQQPSFTSTSTSSSGPSSPAISSPPLSPTSTPFTPSRPSTPLPVERMEVHVLQLAQFHTLLAIFTRTILRTFKSRYTQFLLFWFASRDAAFADLFLGELIAHALLEPTEPEIARAAAASYVASFVSRATYIGPNEARGAVRVLCRFLEHDVDAYEASDDDAAPPGVFYAVAQAVFLIFCFRWRDLVEADDNADAEGDREQDTLAGPRKRMWMAELSIVKRVVMCPLQPLKFCSENVARQFARVAHVTGFMYVFPLLSAPPPPACSEWQRAMLPGNNSISTLRELTSFFPFDPYKLPRSSTYIEPIYREWASVAIEGDDDDDDDDDDDELRGKEGIQVGFLRCDTVGDVDLDADGLGASLGGMSISPVRAPVYATTTGINFATA